MWNPELPFLSTFPIVCGFWCSYLWQVCGVCMNLFPDGASMEMFSILQLPLSIILVGYPWLVR